MLEDLDLNALPDENSRELVRRLLNLIEQLSAELRKLREENQQLRDENNRLKGEQGKPNVKANVPKPLQADQSSEKERRKPRERHKSSKKAKIVVTREETVKVDQTILPEDAEFKGYEEVVVQDVILKTDNVCFRKEKYYAASTGKTYLAELPQGYEGQFGPGVKAMVLALSFGMGATIPKIAEFLKNAGVQISEGTVSNLLNQKQGAFHAEKDALYEAGLKSSPWQHTDDTQTRVNGENQHCHVVCNPLYTIYQTMPGKDRLTVLDVLRNGRERRFRLNLEALGYLRGMALSKAAQQALQAWCSEVDLGEIFFRQRLDSVLPTLGVQMRKAIVDAAAVAAYHAQTDFPVVRTLLCDDAPQFNWLTKEMMQCWVHEGRAYKKLCPVVPLYRQRLEDFRKRFWEYYDQLLTYRQNPTSAESLRLEAEFEQLFSTRSGYDELDKRIAKTKAKKDVLLLVLKHPELPLHNNPAELAVRQRVRKRDISFGPRTEAGKRAWDTFMSLADTTRKLGVSFYTYLQDRITGAGKIPPLATLIEKAAQELNLGQSWISA